MRNGLAALFRPVGRAGAAPHELNIEFVPSYREQLPIDIGMSLDPA